MSGKLPVLLKLHLLPDDMLEIPNWHRNTDEYQVIRSGAGWFSALNVITAFAHLTKISANQLLGREHDKANPHPEENGVKVGIGC